MFIAEATTGGGDKSHVQAQRGDFCIRKNTDTLPQHC